MPPDIPSFSEFEEDFNTKSSTFQGGLSQFLGELKRRGVTATLVSGERSRSQQQSIWNRRDPKTGLFHGNPVAPPGSSLHEVDLARDYKFSGPLSVDEIGKLAEAHGLQWGGRFKHPDPGHFQAPSDAIPSFSEFEKDIPNFSKFAATPTPIVRKPGTDPASRRGAYMAGFDGLNKDDQALNKLARDIEWHFGYSTLAAFSTLPEAKQAQIAQMATEFAKADEVKKKTGVAIPESPAWKLRNQRAVGIEEGKDFDVRQRPEVDAQQRAAWKAGNPELQNSLFIYHPQQGATLPAGVKSALARVAGIGVGGMMELTGGGLTLLDKAFNVKGEIGPAIGARGRLLKEAVASAEKAAPLSTQETSLGPLGKVRLKDEAVNMLGTTLEYAPMMVAPEAELENLFAKIGFGAMEFGAYTGTQSVGRGDTPIDVLKNTAAGAATGGVLKVPLPGKTILRRFASNILITGGGSTVVNLATGQPLEEAARNGLAISLLRTGDVINNVKVRDGDTIRRATPEDIEKLVAPGINPDLQAAMDKARQPAINRLQKQLKVEKRGPVLPQEAASNPILISDRIKQLNEGIERVESELATTKDATGTTGKIKGLQQTLVRRLAVMTNERDALLDRKVQKANQDYQSVADVHEAQRGRKELGGLPTPPVDVQRAELNPEVWKGEQERSVRNADPVRLRMAAEFEELKQKADRTDSENKRLGNLKRRLEGRTSEAGFLDTEEIVDGLNELRKKFPSLTDMELRTMLHREQPELFENDVHTFGPSRSATVTVFKNPTGSDMREIQGAYNDWARDRPWAREDSYREFTDTQGNTYRWMAADATHDDVSRFVKEHWDADAAPGTDRWGSQRGSLNLKEIKDGLNALRKKFPALDDIELRAMLHKDRPEIFNTTEMGGKKFIYDGRDWYRGKIDEGTKIADRGAIARLNVQAAKVTASATKTPNQVKLPAPPVTQAAPQQLGPDTAERAFPTSVDEAGYSGGTDRTYEVMHNPETVKRANETIKTKGLPLAVAEMMNTQGRFSADDVAVGTRAIQMYERQGEIDKAVDVAENLGRKLTEAGQTVQAASLIAKLSPEGIILHAQRKMPKGEKLTAEQAKKFVDEANEVKSAEAGLSKAAKESSWDGVSKPPDAVLDAQTRLRQAKGALRNSLSRIEQTKWEQGLRTFFDTTGIPQAIMTSWDLSFGLRQGKMALGRGMGAVVPEAVKFVRGRVSGPEAIAEMVKHPAIWARAMKQQVKALNTPAFNRLVSEIELDPDYAHAQKFGLELTSSSVGTSDLASRTEGFQTNLANRIPGVLRSEQAYSTAGDWIRLPWFKDYIAKARDAGFDPENPDHAAVFKFGASLINKATGRGELGPQLNAAAPLLNKVLFSTRFWASRVQILSLPLDPRMYARMPKAARAEALKTTLGFYALVGAQLLLAKAAGAEVGLDPDSADFLQAKWGPLHIDFSAGLRGHLRFAAHLTKAVYEQKVQGKQRQPHQQPLAVVGTYLREKEAPLVSLVHDTLNEKDVVGQPSLLLGKPGTGAVNRITDSSITKRFLPLTIQDAKQAYQTSGIGMTGIVLPLAIGGEGVQFYNSKTQDPEQERKQLKADLKMRLRSGDATAITEMYQLKAAGKLTEDEVNALDASRKTTPLQDRFNRLSLAEAERRFKTMTPAEQSEVQQILFKKRER